MPHNRFWNLLSKKMSGEASADELQELELLMKEYPEMVYSAEQIEHLWKLQPLDTYAYESELAFQQHLNNLNKQGIYLPELEQPANMYDTFPKPAKRAFKKIALVLCLVLFGSACLIIWKNSGGPSTELIVKNKNFKGEVSTGMGNRTKLILPDSTVVWLNASSKLNYDEQFGITNRNTILSGEAYFDVKRSEIPFIIKASQVTIKVLGTAFNVKSYPEDKTTETSLVRGEVEVTIDKRPGEKIILKPNEKLTVANDQKIKEPAMVKKAAPIVVLGTITHSQDNSIIETSWVENKLIFQDESFGELAVKMERWYGVEIEFADEKIEQERLSGTFTRQTIQEALEILQMTTSFKFSIKSNVIIITQ